MTQHSEQHEQDQRWRLLDAIEDGELTREQRRCLSRIVHCLGLSSDRFGADAVLSVVQVHYDELINNVTEGEK